jgi:biopolymer transport protein ExbD
MYYVRKKHRPPEIQMAPLIDMVFLLLIFFMVATVFPENSGVEVEKPRSSTSKPLIKGSLLFAITEDGDCYHSGAQVSLGRVSEIIRGGAMEKPDVSVIIEIDRKAITDHLIKFLDTAREAGARNIAVATRYPDQAK